VSATARGSVLVTGAAGFVGAAVVRRLVERGWRVHALVRAATRRGRLAGLPLALHAGDLLDPSSVAAALRSAADAAGREGDALSVVHCAASISYRRADRELLARTNVEGTRAVLSACRAVGARRLCHVSSVVALGAVSDPASFLEDDAALGGLQLDCAYARTKAQAEELVAAASDALDVAIASPAVVFGRSGEGSNSGHFLERLAQGSGALLSPPGSLSVVGLEDTADGIVAVLERGVRGRRYLLAESAWSLSEILALACRLLGRKGPRITVPAPPWRALAALLAIVDPLVQARRATPEAVRLLGLHFRFRARRAREELGWTPVPFPAVLEEVLAELRERRTAPR
jgi:dihydroflavonol-4-reductase